MILFIVTLILYIVKINDAIYSNSAITCVLYDIL